MVDLSTNPSADAMDPASDLSTPIQIADEPLSHRVHLSAITKKLRGYYRYEIKFHGHERIYTGYVRVPDQMISAAMKEMYTDGEVVTIEPTDDNRCRATLHEITKLDQNANCFIRRMTVQYRNSRHRLQGQCWIPRDEDTQTRRGYEAQTALPSTEDVPEEASPTRTVVFEGIPRAGKKVKVKVAEIDDEGFYSGTADVIKVANSNDSDDGALRYHLTIRAPVAWRDVRYMIGDYPDNGSKRHGPFEEVTREEALDEESESGSEDELSSTRVRDTGIL